MTAAPPGGETAFWSRFFQDPAHGPLAALAGFLIGAFLGGVLVAALLATAMGMQNTAARRLAVPDLTTTVLTMPLTGIAADSGRSSGLTMTRRALAVLTMLLGAAVGALLVLYSAPGVALFLLGLVGGVAACRSRRTAPWHTYHLTT